MLFCGFAFAFVIAAIFLVFNYATGIQNEMLDRASEEYFMSMQQRPPPEEERGDEI